MRLRAGTELGTAMEIARAVDAAGGRALLVGGYVRDRVMRELVGSAPPEARDLDLEVFGIEAKALPGLLEPFGSVNSVGASYRIYKVAGLDVGLPRRDSKIGPGHRGFAVEGDPSMTVEEAVRRRDFTINAMLWDPLTEEVLDPCGGKEDVVARRLAAVDPETFGEDPLRVLRAAQFAARFGFSIDPDTVALCRSLPLDDLAGERVWGEMEKLLLRAKRPSIGLEALRELGVVDKLFPELQALVGCMQEPDVHPEGDVWVHTLQAVDAAASRSEDLDRATRLTVLLAVLCHDLGKPATVNNVEDRIRFIGHEAAGAEPTVAFLDRLKVHAIGELAARPLILKLVAHHLAPSAWHRSKKVTDAAFRRLAVKVNLDLLCRVAQADLLGRIGPPGTKPPSDAAVAWFRGRARELKVEHEGPKPLLQGRHLLEMGLEEGPRVGKIAGAVYEMQLDGTVTSLEEAQAAARRLMGD